MAHFIYSPLLEAIINLTKNGKLTWNKQEINKYQFSCLTDNGVKILLDQYTAINDNESTPCTNMTVFDESGKIVDEIVLCESSPEERDYLLINDLYSTVSKSLYTIEKEEALPKLNEITQSLQKMVLAE